MNEEWELTWERDDGELYFKNEITGEKVAAKPKYASTTIQDKLSPAAEYPSERQKKEALVAALEAGYSKHLLSQILSYGVNLNTRIPDLDLSQTPDTSGSLSYYCPIRITPLEWAVEYERLDLVHLFLDHSADANITISQREGPALVRAVRRKLQGLVEAFLQKTDRVSRTRPLALAVEQQDITLATILLAYGVHCDFEESDRPLPPDPFSHDHDYILWRGLEAEDLTPPLVRAARFGNCHLARLLLAHGADANIAYHDLGGRKCDDNPHGYGYRYRYETSDSRIPAYFSCGRVIQLAMEMGHTELVRVLVDAGADINLAHPDWCVLGHICQPVPRTVYLEVMDGIKAAGAEEGNAG